MKSIIENFEEKIEHDHLENTLDTPEIIEKIKIECLVGSTSIYIASLKNEILSNIESQKCQYKDCSNVPEKNSKYLYIICRRYFHFIHNVFLYEEETEYNKCIFCVTDN